MEPIDLGRLKALYEAHIAALRREYDRVLAAGGWDGVMIHSGNPKLRSSFDDAYWPLRPTPHWHHWLPLGVPDSGLLLAPGKKPVLYRNVEKNFWEAPSPPETDHFWGSFEVVEMEKPDLVKEVRPRGKIAFIGEDVARGASWGFEDGARNPSALLKAMDALRVIKTDYELACLREANRRAALGHGKVLQAFQAGDHSELSLHLMFLEATSQDDAETPYKNIVALGEHAATLHHIGYTKTKTGSHSILLDAGATYQGYASDVTRTAVKGHAHGADAYASLLAKMETLQLDMCTRVKPGIPYEKLHNESHELLAGVLRDVGISTSSADELVASGATRKFLPHGLGHSLGLQTHDVGCAELRAEPRNPFLRNTTTVAEGQVFTIEPGCYFIDPLLDDLKSLPVKIDWKLVDALRAFGGIRIEDDLRVTATGSVNLTREALP